MTEPVIEYQPRTPSRIVKYRHVLILLIITLAGGLLRFWNLSQPALWGDEAATYARTSSDYQDLIDRLQFDGFVPLHYELYQWIHDGMPLWAHVSRWPIVPTDGRNAFGFRRASAARPATLPTTAIIDGQTVPAKLPDNAVVKRFLIAEHPIVPGGVRMTPIVMRLAPAIAGTLMIPAMYFLAVQIVNRRAALIAAAFTACSAYLLVYSRDAKMYSELWLFATLSVACLLWWLRVRTRLAWLCWVAASVAMCGIHAPGAVLLAIELLVFLSYNRDWWIAGAILVLGFLVAGCFHGQTRFFSTHVDDRWLVLGFAFAIAIAMYVWRRTGPWMPPIYFVLGLAIILSGMGGYYLKFNRWVSEIDERNWNASMLQWVDGYNQGRDVSNFITFPATAYLLSWEWTQPKEEPFVGMRTLKLLHAAVYVIAALALIGLLPWQRLRRGGTVEADEHRRQPLGVRLLWIIGWIVVPAYAFYCVSMGAQSKLEKGVFTAGFASPNDWFAALGEGMRSLGWWSIVVACGIAAMAYVSARTWRERALRSAGVVAAIAIVLALCSGSYLLIRDYNHRALLTNVHWHSLWMPRYLGTIWPAFAITLATLLSRLPTRGFRYGAVTFVLVANLVQFGARVKTGEPPTELLARDMLTTAPQRTYLLGSMRYGWGGARPGEGLVQSPAWRYYLAEIADLKLTPQAFRTNPAAFNLPVKSFTSNNTTWIANDLKRSPQIQRIVVWDKVDQKPDIGRLALGSDRDIYRDDPLPQQTGGTWKKSEERTFEAFDHWTWQNLYTLRRRVYVRVGR